MLTSAPYLETLEAVLQNTAGLLLAVPRNHDCPIDIASALASLNLNLWHLNVALPCNAPGTIEQGEFDSAFVLLLKPEPESLHAQQALVGDMLALSQLHKLRCWHLPKGNARAQDTRHSPFHALECLQPHECVQLLQRNHLTRLTGLDIAQTILGRLGRKIASDRVWEELSPFKPLHVAFIHGFQGSVKGQKATYLERFCLQHRLPFMALTRSSEESPEQSLQHCQQQLAVWQHQPVLLVGSSLGGFFARQLAHKLKHPCLLINPSVMPQTTLLGRLPESACRLFNAYPMRATPGMHLLLATDDDLLDHSITELMLKGAHISWHDGQGHRWRDNDVIGQAILSLNERHQRVQHAPPIDTSPASI